MEESKRTGPTELLSLKKMWAEYVEALKQTNPEMMPATLKAMEAAFYYGAHSYLGGVIAGSILGKPREAAALLSREINEHLESSMPKGPAN